jgi:hypothetical protein
VAALPAGEKWAFELKLDGYRCIAVKRGKEVTLFSRHRKVLNQPFPGVINALASLKGASFWTESWSSWIPKADHRSNCCMALSQRRFLRIFTPLTYWTRMASFW